MHELQCCRLTNMCLLRQGSKILVQRRTKKDWPGITFPGGHVEKGEGLKDAMIREFYEETGLTLLNPVLRGIEEFKTQGEDRYLIFFYVADAYCGEIRSSEEGEVFWLERSALTQQELALDLLRIVEVMENDEISALRYYQQDGKWCSCLE